MGTVHVLEDLGWHSAPLPTLSIVPRRTPIISYHQVPTRHTHFLIRSGPRRLLISCIPARNRRVARNCPYFTLVRNACPSASVLAKRRQNVNCCRCEKCLRTMADLRSTGFSTAWRRSRCRLPPMCCGRYTSNPTCSDSGRNGWSARGRRTWTRPCVTQLPSSSPASGSNTRPQVGRCGCSSVGRCPASASHPHGSGRSTWRSYRGTGCVLFQKMRQWLRS